MSDTAYNQRAEYLKEQERIQNQDKVYGANVDASENGVVPFTKTSDKEYRAKQIAWRAGKQRVLQPVWADRDQRFQRDKTLLIALVASDRMENGRAVNVSKRSWYVRR